AQIEMPDVGLVEVLGQQAEAGYDAGPPPLQRFEAHDVDREPVAWLRTLDVDWPGERIQLREIHLTERRGRAAWRHLVVGDFGGLAVHRIARFDLDGGRVALVPLVVDLARVECVLTSA